MAIKLSLRHVFDNQIEKNCRFKNMLGIVLLSFTTLVV